MDEMEKVFQEEENNEVSIIEMEPAEESDTEEKGIFGKVLGVAAVGVAGALVTLKLTKKKREAKKKEKYANYLRENGFSVEEVKLVEEEPEIEEVEIVSEEE